MSKQKKRAAKHSKEKSIGKILKNFILNILLLAILAVIVVSAYNIVNWCIDSKKNNEVFEKVSNLVTVVEEKNSISKYNVDFDALKQTNADTVAWLKINGTKIEYPVVHTSNNDYYLTHSFDKSYNTAGWIFADYRNKIDGTDKNIIIYGHNMRSGSMFASLKNILNEDWYKDEKNRKIILVTEEGQAEYEVFSVYQISKDDYDTTIKFSSDEKFMNYVENAKNNSIYNFYVNVSSEDSILTVSTCADNSQYRIVLQAVKVEE